MTAPTDVFSQAHLELTAWGCAVVSGANTAPRLTIDAVEALRAVLDRHQPRQEYDYRTSCLHCRAVWPCPDAVSVLRVLGLPEAGE